MPVCRFKREGILCILIFVLFLSFCQLYKNGEKAALQKQEITVLQSYRNVLPSSRELSMYIEDKAERERIRKIQRQIAITENIATDEDIGDAFGNMMW